MWRGMKRNNRHLLQSDSQSSIPARMRRGFTLVELSIVLVIIGLLIGGILVAQSMISTSKITAQVAQIQQFDAGVMSFKAKYNYLPGDAPAFGGDGDGLIDSSSDYVSRYSLDIANFWHSIDPSKFSRCTTGGTPGCKVETAGPTINAPLSKAGKPGSFFMASAISTGGNIADLTLRANYYTVLNSTQIQAPISGTYSPAVTRLGNGSFQPSDVLALDKKLDDGLGNSGNVLAGGIGYGGAVGSANGMVGASWYQCTFPHAPGSNPEYDIATKDYTCTPLIRIGAQAGDPQ